MAFLRPIRLTRASVLIVVGSSGGAAVATAAVGAFVLDGAAGATLEMLRAVAWVGSALLVVGTGVAWLCGRNVAGDFEFLTRRLRVMASSGQNDPIAVRSLDEVGELTRAFEVLRVRFLESVEGEQLAREQAEQAARYRTEFLTAVSHELRTPLNSILGFAHVLLQEIEGPLDASQKEDVEMIRSSGEHLLALFNDVLDLSAMASGGIELHLETVDVGAIVAESAKLLEAQREGEAVAIRTLIEPDLPKIEADPKRIRQIVMNLGTNAVKFTAKGSVTLATHHDGNHIVIAVRDTGAGIAGAELATIFEEYMQVGDMRSRQRGSGLGLAICRRLTELHGGTIEVESELKRGSEFRVLLPIRRAAA